MASNISEQTGVLNEQRYDAVIVGAGFSGIHMLKKLRQQGFSVTVFEAGSDFGGVWYWNCYPGARVDHEHTEYTFSQDELWKDFEWSERFPGRNELRNYFGHVDKKLGLRKDVQFDTRVTAATFHRPQNQWFVETDRKVSAWASYLILCTGFASKPYIPAFEGWESFKGPCFHTALWPQEGVDLTGKRVAVIGTGASGVQVIQEIGPLVSQLTVYQRTPNTAFPMRQYSESDKNKWITSGPTSDKKFAKMRSHFNGCSIDMPQKGNFPDIGISEEANATAYEFWCKKTRARIKDPVKKDLLAPLVAPHPIGAMRPSLEQHYYEVFNQDNVDLIDLTQSPIIRITKSGVETKLEGETEVDVLILATGLDAATGGINNIDIVNAVGEKLRDKWKNGLSTYLGLTCAGFTNMFFLYGPQAPTAFATSPVCIEIQGDWLTDMLVKMKNAGESRVEVKSKAEEGWVQKVHIFWNATLLSRADSAYQGSNIPGKLKEPLYYLGGIPNYIQELEQCKNNDYDSFIFN